MTPDALKWLLDHTAAAYESEEKVTDKLKERISFVLTVAITPFAGIAIYLASHFKGENLRRVNILFFWTPWLAGALLIAFSAGLVAYVLLRGFAYSKVPLPSQIIDFFTFHDEPDNVLEYGQTALLREYAASVDHNVLQNSKRATTLLRAQRLESPRVFRRLQSLREWSYEQVEQVFT